MNTRPEIARPDATARFWLENRVGSARNRSRFVQGVRSPRLDWAFFPEEDVKVRCQCNSDESDGVSQNSCSQPLAPASSDDLDFQSPFDGPPSPYDSELDDTYSPLEVEADE